MSDFNFLSQLQEIEVPEVQSGVNKTIERVPSNGGNLRILIGKGLVTPSEELANALGLNYDMHGGGNGLDVVDSLIWPQYKNIVNTYLANGGNEDEISFPLFLTAVPRKIDNTSQTKKLDLFGNYSAVFDKDTGEIKHDIFTGTIAPNKSNVLIEAILNNVYGESTQPKNYFNELEWTNASEEVKESEKASKYAKAKVELMESLINKYFPNGYVDLKLNLENPFSIKTSTLYLPKKKKPGTPSESVETVSRRNVPLYTLEVIEQIDRSAEDDTSGTEFEIEKEEKLNNQNI